MKHFTNSTGCLEHTQQGALAVNSFLVSTWRPPRIWLSTWSQRKIHFKTHVFVSESIFTFRKTHLVPSHGFPAASSSAFLQGAALRTPLSGFACGLLQPDGASFSSYPSYEIWWMELPHKVPCSAWDVYASSLVNSVACFREEWKHDCHLPQDPVRLLAHLFFLGSHTIPLTKINFTSNQTNTSLF